MNNNYQFSESFKAVRIIEALENYAIADDLHLGRTGSSNNIYTFHDDEQFWQAILAKPDEANSNRVTSNKYTDALISLANFTLSDWVPRVPGLYFNEGARQIRARVSGKVGGGAVEEEVGANTIFKPNIKSEFILGGIGTNRFFPARDGGQIVSICTSNNVSRGIPVIIPWSVLHRLGLEPGQVLKITNARWQPMDIEWAQRFETIRGIPRAYLVIEDESQVSIISQGRSPIYQPFSIIEYADGDALFYDYVFMNTHPNDSSQIVGDFFENYRQNWANNGRYLLASDSINPFIDAEFTSPEQLRQAEPGSRYHLNILKERVKQTYFGKWQLDSLVKLISSHYYEGASIKRIATYINFPSAQFINGTASDKATQLVDWCVQNKKVEELIDKIGIDKPQVFVQHNLNQI